MNFVLVCRKLVLTGANPLPITDGKGFQFDAWLSPVAAKWKSHSAYLNNKGIFIVTTIKLQLGHYDICNKMILTANLNFCLITDVRTNEEE